MAAPLSETATPLRTVKYSEVIFALGTFVRSQAAKASCSCLR